MANVTGWGRSTWGDGAWGQEAPVAVTGLSSTSSLGSVSVTASCLVVEDGVTSLIAHGQVSTQLLQVVTPTSATGTGQTTTPNISGDANFSITGVGGTLSLGTVDAVSVAEVTGVSSTGGLGTVTMTGTANIAPTGVEDTGQLGTPSILLTQTITAPSFLATGALNAPTIFGDANFSITGVSGTNSVGSVVPFAGADVNVTGEEASLDNNLAGVVIFAGAKPVPTGVSAASSVGSTTVTGTCVLTLSGVSSTGDVSTPVLWGEVTIAPTATWNGVAA